MGNQNTITYGRFVEGTEKPGHTAELVNPAVVDHNKLMERPSDDVNTLLDAFKRSVRNVPNNPYLGTRNEKVEGRPYEWKTWREVDEITTNLSIAI